MSSESEKLDRQLEQDWRLVESNDLIYFKPTFSNHCIEVTNNNIRNGSTLNLNRCEQTVPGQLFDTKGLRTLSPSSQISVKNANIPYCLTAPPAPPVTQPDNDQVVTYNNQFVTLEQCRDINEFGVSSQQGVDIAKRQQWEAVGDQIKNVETGLCLTALNALNSVNANNLSENNQIQSNVVGTNIIMSPCL